jgi:response regulator RpfG family c-di-GMP phosphodiesterase
MNSLNAEPATKLNMLLLDDEQDIINSLKRVLRKDFNIVTFNDGPSALEYLVVNPIDIIISDMRMPNMNGAEFFARSRDYQPNAIRVLLTGYSDMDSTIKAINEGGIYTYIGKPWDNNELQLLLQKVSEHCCLKKETQVLNDQLNGANNKLLALNSSLEAKITDRTKVLESHKDKLSTTLKSNNALLHDVLEMMSKTIEYRTGFGIGHNKRIALQCKAIARYLKLDDAECRRIYLSALLHEIGMVGLKDNDFKNINFDTGIFNDALNHHPVIGAEILGQIERFSALTENILHQNENIDGTGVPEHLVGDDIPIGARIIRVVKDFDFLIAGKENHKTMAIDDAKLWIMSRVYTWYDGNAMDALFNVLTERTNFNEEMEYSVGIEGVKVGDKLMEDLVLHNGSIMLKTGQEVTKTIIEKLQKYEENFNTKIILFIA